MSQLTNNAAAFSADVPVNRPTLAVVLGGNQQQNSKAAELLERLDCTVTMSADLRAWQGTHAPQATNGFSASGLRPAADSLTPALVIYTGALGDRAEIARIAEATPGAQLLALTDSATVGDAVTAMRLGVSNVLQAGQSDAELADAVADALAKGKASSAKAAERAALRQHLAQLTPAEEEVLDSMLDGMANKQIAQKLEIGLRTVELRRSKIMRKMQAQSLAQLVKFVCIAKGIASS
ncbi:MAG: LuxR C-terminal-related transcriptional regulator [Planctomycetota bacterium]